MNGMRLFTMAGLLSALWIPCLPTFAKPLVIDINESSFRSVPFYLLRFEGEKGDEIQAIVANDLNGSQFFQEIRGVGFDVDGMEARNYPQWRTLGADFLIGARIHCRGGTWQAQVHCFDGPNGKEVLQATLKAASMRSLAHKISDAFYSRITGDKGYFDTRLFFMRKQPGGAMRILSADFDGERQENHSLTPSMAMMPAVSPDGKKLCYMSYERNGQEIILKSLENLASGKARHLHHAFHSIPFAPRFSPDGQGLYMSVSQEGDTSIHYYDLLTNKTREVTRIQKKTIDVSLSFGPDRRSFVYVSDKSGSPQIYKRNAAGSEVRLTQGPGRYYSVSWSPDGQWLAFIKKIQGEYYLGVMRSDGTGERMIARDFIVDYPAWAPNSRMILFSAQQSLKGAPALFVVDISAHVLRKVLDNASQPFWAASNS